MPRPRKPAIPTQVEPENVTSITDTESETPTGRGKRKKASKPKPPKKPVPPKVFVPREPHPDEDVPDGTLLLEFTLDKGSPATKKNHQDIIYVPGLGRRVIPSKQYRKYEADCKEICEAAWINNGKRPIDFGIAISIRVFLPTWSVGDHVGYLQSIGDILEKHGIVANDKFIHWTDGDQHWFGGVDKDNPRVELKIYRLRYLYEDYRQDKEEAEIRKLERKTSREQAKITKEQQNV